MMKKKKVVILTTSMSGGGAERTVSYLLRRLGNEYEIHLLLFKNKIEYDLPENQIIDFLDEDNKRETDVKNILKISVISRRLIKYCHNNDIDLVFSLLSRPNFVACLAKKRGLKAKLLISERIYTPWCYPKHTMQGKIASYLVSYLYPFATAILPNSNQTGMALQEQYKVSGKYIVIKNMLDIKAIQTKRTEKVEDFNFDKFTFVNLARFRVQKNHRLLIEAFAELKMENVQLLLLGEGKLSTEIKQLVTNLGLEDRVFFLGQKSNPYKYLSRADCFVFSSDFEGYPNVLMESMACELPIISTDCRSGPRELLAPETDCQKQIIDNYEIGKYGMLVPIKNKFILAGAMREMIKNEELRNEYRGRLADRVLEFDIDVVIEDYRQIIESFLPSN